MIVYNSKLWNARDPDDILKVDRNKFNIRELKFLGKFHPREDFLCFNNIDSKVIVDFGFYGNEIECDGDWKIYVIDGNLEEGWSSPLELHQFRFNQFLRGINCVQSLLDKYTSKLK